MSGRAKSKATATRVEIIAGITTFFTMAYIVVVNPSILATQGTGMPFSGVLTATVLLAFSMTLLMGVYARLPYAVAPGMGINAYFAFTLILGHRIAWPVALGMIFWAGVVFVLISVTPLRAAIARVIPQNLRIASAAGIGVFLTFIGLKSAGLVVADPATFVKLGTIDGRCLLSVLGIFVTVFLMHRRSPFAFIGGIASVTLEAAVLGYIKPPEHLLSAPDFSGVLLKLDVMGALKLSLVPAIVAIMFTDLFDSISTFVGVSHAAGLLDEKGEPVRLREGLIVDAFATLCAALFGTSSGTAYIESAAGIEMGGRTGLTSVVTALCFLPCLFIGPVAAMVPPYATAPVLIIVGSLMFKSVTRLELERIEDGLPAFLTIVLIPLTFSITQGILWGFIAHAALYVLTGRAREVRPAMYVLSILSLALIVLEYGAP